MNTAKERNILIVEDSLPQAMMYEECVKTYGYTFVTESHGQAAMDRLREYCPSAMLLDLHLPDMEGIEVLRFARRLYPRLPIVVMTVDSSPKAGRLVTKEGAADFLHKPFSADRLGVTLSKVIEAAELAREVGAFRQALNHESFFGFIGQSSPMQAVYRVIESVAVSNASVFITGESGTGKELAAHAIHQASPRRARPFIAINCGAIPRELMESMLFGHVRGAFTGAVNDHDGAARKADGGTLFLDEVTELPLDLQVKLLRFLQTCEMTPVGSSKSETVDVRIIAATNRSPLEEVKAGRLREDLYYRLHVVPLEIPPLRHRDDDILFLAAYFLNKYGKDEKKDFTGFAPEVLRIFRRYEWPGNVRELENTIRTAVVLNKGPLLDESMLPGAMRALGNVDADSGSEVAPNAAEPKTDMVVKPLWLIEKEAILHVLDITHQDVAKAAALLEVSPSTLYRKLQAWKAAGEA